MSETPQINENEYIQVNYDGTQINAAIGAALGMKSGSILAQKALKDGNGNVIANTYATKNKVDQVEELVNTKADQTEVNQIHEDIDTKVDKSRILQYIDYTIDETNKTVTITGIKSGINRNNLIGDFSIPETIEGYPVVAIGDSAFSDCINIRSIVIPNSVRIIGQNAFSSCTSLSFVNISNSITDIGDQAFTYCAALLSINLPSSIKQIKSGTFSYTGLTSIVIPDSVISIGSEAFAGSTSLINVNLGQKIESIGSQAFEVCRHLTNLFIPESLNTIESEAFGGIDDLTNIYYGGTEEQWADLYNRPSVISGGQIYYNQRPVMCDELFEYLVNIQDNIEQKSDKPRILDYIDYTIDGNLVTITGLLDVEPTDLIGDFIIPETIEGYPVFSIGNGAFQGCSEITSIFLPNTIAYIGDYAFNGCIGLSMINIPNLVQSIGECAFRECAFIDINIPESVIFIGDAAFQDCYALKNVTIYRHFSVYEPAPEIE